MAKMTKEQEARYNELSKLQTELLLKGGVKSSKKRVEIENSKEYKELKKMYLSELFRANHKKTCKIRVKNDAFNKIEKALYIYVQKHSSYVSQSPYSDSFYTTTEKGWGYTPAGTKRVSDHWNIKNGTDLVLEGYQESDLQMLAVAKYNSKKGVWVLDKKETEKLNLLAS